MNLASLVLGLVFLALGSVFIARSKREPDAKARNSRFAGMLMILAAAGFFVAVAIRFLGD